MKIEDQEQVWSNIAPEWHEFKNNPRKEVLEFLQKQEGNILDFGSGSGRYLTKLDKRGKMWLVDFSKEMIKFAKEKARKLDINAEFCISDLRKTGFQDNFFDAAIFIDALHCIEGDKNRENAVKELFRVMKPRTEAIVSVWNRNSRKFKGKSQEKYIAWKDKGKRYYYLFEPEEIYKLFEKIGFKIKQKFKPDEKILFIAKKP